MRQPSVHVDPVVVNSIIRSPAHGRHSPCRCEDRGDPPEGTSAQSVCPSCESAPVIVGQAKASPTQLTPQHPILLHQIREGIALPTIQPAGKNEKEQLKGRRVDHGRSLDQPSRVDVQSVESWDSTGVDNGSTACANPPPRLSSRAADAALHA